MPDAPPVDAPPAAPAAVEPPAAPAAPEPAAPAAAAPAAPAGDNLPDDPAALKTMIAELRKENGSARTNAKAQAAEDARNELTQSLGKALGLIKDDTPLDPAQLTASLTTAQTEAKQARVELAVFSAAANKEQATGLLDSSSFLKSLDGVDPTDAAAVQAKVTAAVTANPHLAALGGVKVPAPTPGQGAAGAGIDLQTQLAAATAAGDIQRSVQLRQQIAAELQAQK
jgi:hypothetical protein